MRVSTGPAGFCQHSAASNCSSAVCCSLTCSAPSASSSSLSMRKPSSSYCEVLPGFCVRFGAEAAAGVGCCLCACPGAACGGCCGSYCGAGGAGAVLPAENLQAADTCCLRVVVCRKQLARHTWSGSVQPQACSRPPCAAAALPVSVSSYGHDLPAGAPPGTGCSCPF